MHQLAAWSKRRVRTFRKEAGCVHVHWCRLTYRLIRDIYDDLKRNWDNMKQRSELTHNIENIVITQYMLQIVRTSGLYQYQLLHHIPPCLTELLVHKFLSIWDPVTLKVHLKFDNILPITQHTGNLDASLSGHNIQLNILKSLWQKATLAELFKIWCGSQSKKMARQRFLLSSLSEANLSSTHYTIPQEFAGFFVMKLREPLKIVKWPPFYI